MISNIGRIRCLMLVVVLLKLTSTCAQNPAFDRILGKLRTYALINAPEKVYVHTDRDYYRSGETIWFKAYLLNGITHRNSQKSKIIYVELLEEIENKIIAKRKLYVDSVGAHGAIDIPGDLAQGKYILRAFTKYMLNEKELSYYKKEIPIWTGPSETSGNLDEQQNYTSKFQIPPNSTETPIATKPEVVFLPKDQQLVAGIPNQLGILLTDHLGNGLATEGEIRDENDQVIATFHTSGTGLDDLTITPEAGHIYYAIFPFKGVLERYQLPQITPHGYALQINDKDSHLLISVASNGTKNLEGTLLVGHLRGNLFFKHYGKAEEKEAYTIKLLTETLNSGLANFTLFDPEGKVLAERIIFIDRPKKSPKLTLGLHKQNYTQRDKVSIALGLEDQGGRALKGNFSMSVAKSSSFFKGALSHEAMKRWLLLESDLNKESLKAKGVLLDSVWGQSEQLNTFLLQSTWDRFAWADFLQNNVSKKAAYIPEKGLMISGKTTDLKNRFLPKPATVSLGMLDESPYYDTKLTNALGEFSFGPFVFNDSIEVVLNGIATTATKNSAQNNISIELDPILPPNLPLHSSESGSPESQRNNTRAKYNHFPSEFMQDFDYENNIIKLDEAVIKAKRKTTSAKVIEELNSITPYGKAKNRVIIDSISAKESFSMLDVLNFVPGIQIRGIFPNQTIRIRGGLHSINLSTEPLFLVDGVVVPFNVVQQMNTFGILFVDVLLGAEAAFYGVRGANGVIAVYTDRGANYSFTQKRSPGIINFTMYGFSAARTFPGPDYALSSNQFTKTDLRTTLHWEPNIILNSGHNMVVSFFTDDSSGAYTIKIEGITTDGQIVSELREIHVE